MHVRAMRRTDDPSPVAGVEIVRRSTTCCPAPQHVVLAAPATPKRGISRCRAFAHDDAGRAPREHRTGLARGSGRAATALDDGTVAMATLDTVDPEPLPAGHWMYSHPRVRLTAHISWYTPDMQREALEHLSRQSRPRFERGEPLMNVVDPDEGY